MLARVAGVVLGVLFLVAGVAKRADRVWPLKAASFGVPGWAGRVLPFVELGLGALLITGIGSPFWPWVAVILLIGFTVKLVFLLVQGIRPPCACFGVRSSRPISAWSVVRNAVLIALAVVAATA